MSKISVFSEYNPISLWLTTPVGYYVDKPEFGNNLHLLLFKNIKKAKTILPDILDKIELDLGENVLQNIENIMLLEVKEKDNLLISIQYIDSILTKELTT